MKKTLFTILLFWGFYSQAQSNFFNGSLGPKCGINIVRDSCLSHYISGCLTDGDFSIIANGNQYTVRCDMVNGGWTPISAGGSTCGTANFIQKDIGGTINPLNAESYTSTCGYMSEPDTKALANISSTVRLRVGTSPSVYSEAISSGNLTMIALRTSATWHNGAYAEFSGTWDWNFTCATTATKWPDMYQSCGNGNGVNWMIFAGVSIYHSQNLSPQPYSSTWIK